MIFLKEVKIGIIAGLIGFIFVVVPILMLLDWLDTCEAKPIVIYFKEID